MPWPWLQCRGVTKERPKEATEAAAKVGHPGTERQQFQLFGAGSSEKQKMLLVQSTLGRWDRVEWWE